MTYGGNCWIRAFAQMFWANDTYVGGPSGDTYVGGGATANNNARQVEIAVHEKLRDVINNLEQSGINMSHVDNIASMYSFDLDNVALDKVESKDLDNIISKLEEGNIISLNKEPISEISSKFFPLPLIIFSLIIAFRFIYSLS